MKYLILFLITLNVNAMTVSQFRAGIKALKYPRKTVVKVTGNLNSKMWFKKNAKSLGPIGRDNKLAEFIAQDAIYVAESDTKKTKENKKKQVKARIKAANCGDLSSISAILVDMCKAMKGR